MDSSASSRTKIGMTLSVRLPMSQRTLRAKCFAESAAALKVISLLATIQDLERVIEAMEQGGTYVYTLSSAERRAVAIGMAQAKRGEFVSDQDLETFRNRRPSGAEQLSHDGNPRA